MSKIKIFSISLLLFFISCEDPSNGGGIITSPEIAISYEDNDIPNGTGTYNFGSVLVDGNGGISSDEVTFKISNIGNANLSLASLNLSSGDIGDFDLVYVHTSDIEASSNTTFTIRFDPLSLGNKSAVLTIENNDPDEGNYTFTLIGSATAIPVPEINVICSSINIQNNGVQDFGSTIVDYQDDSTANIYEFSVENIGSADLNISDITINSGDINDFEIIESSPYTIAPSNEIIFSVQFVPITIGNKTATITISNNDSDESSYIINITGEGTAAPEPEILVRQNSTTLISNSSIYDFDSILADGNGNNFTENISFIIENIGTANLDISNISITSGDIDDFDLLSDADFNIIPASNSSFGISFDPLTPGNKSAIVTIISNDSDEAEYTFTINGNGIAPAPELEITLNGDEISNGSFVDLGSVLADGDGGATSTESFFNITNLGSAVLNISDIFISGNDTLSFDFVDNSSGTIDIGETATFVVTFDPLTSGDKSITMTIQSDDLDEGNFIFDIIGTAIPYIPEINIKQGSSDLHNDIGMYDFGDVGLGFASSSIPFTIENLGPAPLLLTGDIKVLITGSDASMFSVVSQPSEDSLESSESTDFFIRFSSTNAGERSALVTVSNNDSDENPYTFEIKANSVGADIELVYPNETGLLEYSSGFEMGSGITRSVSIKNVGYDTLIIDSVTFTGPDADMFSASIQDITIPTSSSSNLSFVITPTRIGDIEATIHISSNDLDESNYSFNIKTKGLPERVYSSFDDGMYSHIYANSAGVVRIAAQNTEDTVVQVYSGFDDTVRVNRIGYNNYNYGNYLSADLENGTFLSWIDTDTRKLYKYQNGSTSVIVDSGRYITWNTIKAKGASYVVCYYDGTSSDLVLYDPANYPNTTTILDSDGWVGEYNDMVIDSLGNIHISYYDSMNGCLKYVTNKSGVWVISTLDSEGDNVGLYTSIDIDSNDNIHISYYVSGSYTYPESLRYINNVGGSWNTPVIIEEGDNGAYSSLDLDASDNVHICYYYDEGWPGTSGMKYATNKYGSWEINKLELYSSNIIGRWSSISVDSFGVVHTSCMNSTTGSIEYLRFIY